MELVYLWVEEYKNIRNQGFNFSPRFECEFKAEYEDGKLKDDCKLEITPIEYMNIFPDNINVTAIVGENGSGKTTLFNFMKEFFERKVSFRQPYEVSENKVLILFKKKEIDKFEYITNIDDIKIDHKFISKKNNELLIDILNYSAEFQKEKNNDNDIVISPNEIAKSLTDNFIYKKNFKLSSFMFIPETIEISFNSTYLDKQLENILENKKQKIIDQAINVSYDKEKEAERDMRNSIYNLEDHSADLFEVDDYHKFLIIWFIENHYFDSDTLLNKDSLLKKYQQQEPNEQITEDELLEPCSKKINNFTDREKGIYFENFHYYFSFNFIDSLQREFKDLSHGERVLFGQLINIYYHISQSKKTFILNLDEPELSLHPNWQKNYIFEIINLLQQFDNKIHLIVTSHSPFFLSDLPKENVIFLKKDKQRGLCKNATKDIDIKTFGANIHTLLSHGFFMEDGLMGEFAKKMIQDVINYLDDNPTQNMNKLKAWQIIQFVGEPFLKHKLEEKYNEKFLTQEEQKQNKIKQLEDELKRLRDDNTQS